MAFVVTTARMRGMYFCMGGLALWKWGGCVLIHRSNWSKSGDAFPICCLPCVPHRGWFWRFGDSEIVASAGEIVVWRAVPW